MRLTLLLACAALAISVPARTGAEALLIGRASVIDGDTIEIKGERVRLNGIDEPRAHNCAGTAGTRTIDVEQLPRKL
jgi:endonuclease YncB( thermonuclease family)